MADLKIAALPPVGFSPVYVRIRNRLLFDLGYGVFKGFIHPYSKQPIDEVHPGQPIGTVVAKNEDGTYIVRVGGQGKAE